MVITYSKKISQNRRRSQCELEKNLKELEPNLNSEVNFNEYAKCKKDLQLIYERIAEGVKIKKVKKSTKFCLISKKKDSLK